MLKWVVCTLSFVITLLVGLVLLYAARSPGSQAKYLERAGDPLAPGAEVRAMGRLAPGPTVRSPFLQRECAASFTEIEYCAKYVDSDNESHYDCATLAPIRRGPAELEVLVGAQRIRIPLGSWSPEAITHRGSVQNVSALPSSLEVPLQELERARASVSGRFSHFAVTEWTFSQQQPVFVVGQATTVDSEGAWRLAADRRFQRVLIHPGTQEELVAALRREMMGFRLAACISVALGASPLLVLLAWSLYKRRAGLRRLPG